MKVKGQNIQVYTFNGQLVFIAEHSGVGGIEPIDIDGAGHGVYPIDAYQVGVDAMLAYDEDYSGASDDGTEIVATECVNPENEQRLVSGFFTVEWAVNDWFTSDYLVTTDKYYDWSSYRSVMIDKLWSEAVDGCITSDMRDECKDQWDESIAAFNAKHKTDFTAPFDDVINECGLQIEH